MKVETAKNCMDSLGSNDSLSYRTGNCIDKIISQRGLQSLAEINELGVHLLFLFRNHLS
jgi:hypothetical protein